MLLLLPLALLLPHCRRCWCIVAAAASPPPPLLIATIPPRQLANAEEAEEEAEDELEALFRWVLQLHGNRPVAGLALWAGAQGPGHCWSKWKRQAGQQRGCLQPCDAAAAPTAQPPCPASGLGNVSPAARRSGGAAA